jgi:hypothetical protein
MAATPQFGATSVFAYNTVNTLTANTALDGTGTVTFLQTNVAGTLADWAAPATGAFIDFVKVMHKGTNVLSVMRLFSNSGATNATANNNDLIDDLTLPAYTLVQNAAQPPMIIPIKRWIPSGTKLFYTLGTAVASGYAITVYGSNM